MPRPELSIIIPVFNKWDLTRQCLESLAEHTPGEHFQVIVADNGSTDETPAQLQALGSRLFGDRFTCLRFEENRNFAAGCNAGAAEAHADLLFFLNNDTLMTPNWLPPLTERLKSDPQPGMVGPLLLYPDGRVQHMGVTVNADGFFHLYRFFPSDHPVVRRPRRLQALTAAALLTPKELFDQCGRFHEGYVNGFEDVELSFRVIRAGKRLACVTDSVVYHLESQTPGRKKSEHDNFALLKRRCEGLFHIDIHHHGRKDGFEVALGELGSVCLQLPPEQDRELWGLAREVDLSGQAAILRQNPLWRSGYRLVAERLEKNGALPAALETWTEAFKFFTNSAEGRQIYRLASAMGLTEVVRQTGEILEAFADAELAAIRLRLGRKKAEEARDAFLADLFTEGLAALRKSHA